MVLVPMKTKTSFSQLYSFPGFRARPRFKRGVFQDPKARVVELVRRQKKRSVRVAGNLHEAFTIIGSIGSAIWMPAAIESIWTLSTGAWTAESARP